MDYVSREWGRAARLGPGVALALCLSAIVAPDAAASGPAPEMLVAFAEEPAGTRCAEGGYALTVGLDRNGNHTLEPREIASLEYLCGLVDVALPVVVTMAEPPGARCPHGGTRIEVGAEREPTTTRYLCHDAPRDTEPR